MKSQGGTGEEEAKPEDRFSGSTMELRKVRKATAKKRSLIDSNGNNGNSANNTDKQTTKKKARRNKRPLAKKPKLEEEEEKKVDEENSDDDEEDDDDEDVQSGSDEEDDEDDDNKEEASAAASSESNTMTLEQFTDIVLASEGLSMDKKQPCILEPVVSNASANASNIKEENNNKTSEMVANLMQKNNDLIVEVKPLRPKPVVLSPRQPPGSHLLPHHYRGGGKVSLSSSVVVSVKPRVHPMTSSSSSLTSPAPHPPQNKPPKIPHLVEEWFSKMQPPISEKFPISSSASDLALNLSTKVYLKPIPASELQGKRHLLQPSSSVTISPKVWPSSSTARQQQQQTVVQLPYKQYSPNHHHQSSSHRSTSSSTASSSATTSPPSKLASPTTVLQHPQRLSPPRLEITKVECPPPPNPANPSLSSSLSSSSSSPLRKVGRATPFESSSVHMETVRARAVRDVQLAHSKDMHGNFPIHMSVLMRKPELVRRYCCILQVLESSLDLLNEERMTPLHLAIRDSSLEIIDILLTFGASPSARDRRGNSGLHLATAAKATDVVRRLAKVMEPRDVNVLNDYGLTPLHIATLNGDVASAEALIKHGADSSIPDGLHGLTPLAMAKQNKLNHIIDHIPKKLSHVEIQSR